MTRGAEERAAARAARDGLEELLGRRPPRLSRRRGGSTNRVFEARSGRESCIVRVGSMPEKLDAFRKERWASRRAATAGVPVAEILDVRREGDFAVMVSRTIEGRLAVDSPRHSRTLRQMGELTARIHTVRTRGFGGTWDPRTGRADGHATWSQYLDRELRVEERLTTLERLSLLDPSRRSRLRRALASVRAWSGGPVLQHGDMRLKNVIVDERGNVRAVLDWENSISAPGSGWDLSIALHDLSLDGRQLFLEGFGISPREYAAIAAGLQAINLLNYAPALERASSEKGRRSELEWLRVRAQGLLDLNSV